MATNFEFGAGVNSIEERKRKASPAPQPSAPSQPQGGGEVAGKAVPDAKLTDHLQKSLGGAQYKDGKIVGGTIRNYHGMTAEQAQERATRLYHGNNSPGRGPGQGLTTGSLSTGNLNTPTRSSTRNPSSPWEDGTFRSAEERAAVERARLGTDGITGVEIAKRGSPMNRMHPGFDSLPTVAEDNGAARASAIRSVQSGGKSPAIVGTFRTLPASAPSYAGDGSGKNYAEESSAKRVAAATKAHPSPVSIATPSVPTPQFRMERTAVAPVNPSSVVATQPMAQTGSSTTLSQPRPLSYDVNSALKPQAPQSIRRPSFNMAQRSPVMAATQVAEAAPKIRPTNPSVSKPSKQPEVQMVNGRIQYAPGENAFTALGGYFKRREQAKRDYWKRREALRASPVMAATQANHE